VAVAPNDPPLVLRGAGNVKEEKMRAHKKKKHRAVKKHHKQIKKHRKQAEGKRRAGR
jgi:hypothetical protein